MGSSGVDEGAGGNDVPEEDDEEERAEGGYPNRATGDAGPGRASEVADAFSAVPIPSDTRTDDRPNHRASAPRTRTKDEANESMGTKSTKVDSEDDGGNARAVQPPPISQSVPVTNARTPESTPR